MIYLIMFFNFADVGVLVEGYDEVREVLFYFIDRIRSSCHLQLYKINATFNLLINAFVLDS